MVSFSSHAVNLPVLTIYTEEFPPYNFTANGRVQGINIDIVLLLCKSVNITCNIISLPWNRAVSQVLANHNSGIVSMSRFDEREDQFKWVGPLVNDISYFYRLKSRQEVSPTSLENVTQFTIGASRNDIYEKVLIELGFKKSINLLELTDKGEQVRLFMNGKLDLLIASPMTIEHKLKKYGYDISLVEPILFFPTGDKKGNHLALNKDISDVLVTKMQEIVDLMLKNNEYQLIIDKYKS